ncbi:MAG TPA: peptidylprolyl isomerase [Treponema sp.]|nr:peptidylprolyl isomerase [Treponema sp.]
MKIEKDRVVSINYTLKDDEGSIIDSSEGAEPLLYLHGRNYLLPKLEEQLEGKVPGDSFTVDLSAKDGYGEYNEALVAEVPRSQFDSSMEIEEGMAFQAETPQGTQIVTVTKVSPETITVDANHELAGKNLHFAIQIEDVREATPEELESGMQSCSCGGGCDSCGGDCDSCGGDCGCEGCGN